MWLKFFTWIIRTGLQIIQFCDRLLFNMISHKLIQGPLCLFIRFVFLCLGKSWPEPGQYVIISHNGIEMQAPLLLTSYFTFCLPFVFPTWLTYIVSSYCRPMQIIMVTYVDHHDYVIMTYLFAVLRMLRGKGHFSAPSKFGGTMCCFNIYNLHVMCSRRILIQVVPKVSDLEILILVFFWFCCKGGTRFPLGREVKLERFLKPLVST